MRLLAWAKTDTGKKRDHNEDSFLVDRKLNLFIVCDGMGGHAAGEVASSMAARAVRETLATVLDRNRYRLQLRRRGYYDPYPDEQGLLRDDRDHSVLGLIGIPDPTRPGYILTPLGVSIPVGASLEIRGDRPFVASPAFPGRVLTYIPLLSLTQNGGALTRPIFDQSYFALLEAERQRSALLRERATLIDRSFKAGETPLPELLRALAAATQADTSFARQQVAVGLARARLQQSLGILP